MTTPGELSRPAEAQCWLCGRTLYDSQYEWRVKVWNDDSISATGINVRVCEPCANDVRDMLGAKRRAPSTNEFRIGTADAVNRPGRYSA